MAQRLIQILARDGRLAKIFRNADWEEYIVEFVEDGKSYGKDCDYHTDDRDDAMGTAVVWVTRLGER